MMQQLINVLYFITVALKAPVILALIASMIWMLHEAGGFLREWRERRKTWGKWREFLESIPPEDDEHDLTGEFFALGAYPALVGLFASKARRFPHSREHLDRLVSEIESEANRVCYRLRLWVRLAPMLGLMGTLIPMGPALKAMSTGNLEDMAGNLIIAFSTTVVGLTTGALCYVMFVARQHWYATDLADIEHVFRNVLLSDEDDAAKAEAAE